MNEHDSFRVISPEVAGAIIGVFTVTVLIFGVFVDVARFVRACI